MPKITPAAAIVEERKGAARLILPKGVFYLSELYDALIQSLADGHFLAYDAAISKWKNRALTANDIPDLDAAKITSGVFELDRLPTIPYSKTDFADQELLTTSNPHFIKIFALSDVKIGETFESLYAFAAGVLGTDGGFSAADFRIVDTMIVTGAKALVNVTADAGIITSGKFGDDRLDLSALAQNIAFIGAQTVDGVDVSALPAKCVGDYYAIVGIATDTGVPYYRKYNIGTSTWGNWTSLSGQLVELLTVLVIGNCLYISGMASDDKMYYKIVNLVDDSVVTNWTLLTGSLCNSFGVRIASVEPTQKYTGLTWVDTSGAEVVMKVRNKANNDWKTVQFV